MNTQPVTAKKVLKDPLALSKNILAATAFGIELMSLAGLPILFTVARRIGEHLILTSRWLNEPVACDLPDFASLPNPEYAGLKLLNIFRIPGVSRGFRLSPFKPHKQSVCKTRGGASKNGIGFASSFLNPQQDLLVTMLLLLHAFVGRMRILSVDIINFAKLDEQQAQSMKKLNVTKDPTVQGLGVVWNLRIKAVKYDAAVALLREAFGSELKVGADHVSYSFFDDDPDRLRFFGKLALGFKLTRA